MDDFENKPIKGRGALSNIEGRFSRQSLVPDPLVMTDEGSTLNTEVYYEQAKSLITRNNSPDVPFNVSINPYRGCEHGCVYCFARPTHSYLDWSPGLDFESKLVAKINAAEVFRNELSKPSYRCEPIALGISTDAYQPIERELKITRQLLEVAIEFRQPISIVTKGGLILRDLDLLETMAKHRIIQVTLSITTLNNDLKRILEPRALAPKARIELIRQLRAVGVPVTVLLAPVIPQINEHEIEQILAAVSAAGALSAGYIMLRLPHEVAPLFQQWLQAHFPLRAQHVLNQLTHIGNGKLYSSEFGTRMRGQGVYAELLSQRFQRASRRYGLQNKRIVKLDNQCFKVPNKERSAQLSFW